MPIRKSTTEEERKKKLEAQAKIDQQRLAEGQAFIKAREKEANKISGGATPTGREMQQATANVEAKEPTQMRTPAEVTAAGEEVKAQFEEAGVFKEVTQEQIIPPEQENLGVMLRIAKSLMPKSISDAYKKIDTIGGALDFSSTDKIPQAEITFVAEELKQVIIDETSAEIDTRIEDTEGILIQNGIPLIGVLGTVVGGAVIGSAIAAPVKEFVGTDGQIASLELALSQYNEMITIPSRSLDSGLSAQDAFDKYDRMEEGISALEQQLKISAMTSPKVALALKGRAVEARLIKLKEKLQEGRRIVAAKVLAEGFGEVDTPASIIYLRKLQDERKEKK